MELTEETDDGKPNTSFEQFGDNNSLGHRLSGFLSLCSSHQSLMFLIAHLLLTVEFFGIIYEDMDSSCSLEVVPK